MKNIDISKIVCVYMRGGVAKCITVEQFEADHDKLKSEGWLHTAYINPNRFIEFLINDPKAGEQMVKKFTTTRYNGNARMFFHDPHPIWDRTDEEQEQDERNFDSNMRSIATELARKCPYGKLENLNSSQPKSK